MDTRPTYLGRPAVLGGAGVAITEVPNTPFGGVSQHGKQQQNASDDSELTTTTTHSPLPFPVPFVFGLCSACAHDSSHDGFVLQVDAGGEWHFSVETCSASSLPNAGSLVNYFVV